jgi:HSP20 family protein
MTEAGTKMHVKTGRSPTRRAPMYEGPQPLERLRTDVDRVLSNFLRGYWHVPFRQSVVDVEPYWRGEIGFGATPAVNIVDKDDAYIVTAELPGIREQDIEIKFADGTLTVEGQKEEEPGDEKQEHFLSERRFGAFHRSFRVPDGVDADKIEASLKNGVLTVTLPKSAGARRRQKKIAVKST